MSRRVGLVAAIVVVAANAGVAQESFADLFAAAERVTPREVVAYRKAYLRAYDAFSQIPRGGNAYTIALPKGGVAALRGGQFATAVDLFAEQWSTLGGTDALLTNRMTALFGARRGAEALALGEQQQPGYPSGVRTFFLERNNFAAAQAAADQLLLSGNTRTGVWAFEQLAAAYPDSPGVQANLALTFRRLGRLAPAQAAYEHALKKGPKLAWLWTDYGLVAKGQRRYEDAAKAFFRALEFEAKPGASPAGTNLGVLAIRTGKDRGRTPIADLKSVVRARPDAAMARRLLLDLLARKTR